MQLDQRDRYNSFSADVFIPLARVGAASAFVVGMVWICAIVATGDPDLSILLALTIGGLFGCLFGLATFARSDFVFLMVSIALRIEEFRAATDLQPYIDAIGERDAMIDTLALHIKELQAKLTSEQIKINNSSGERYTNKHSGPEVDLDQKIAKHAAQILRRAMIMTPDNKISISREACSVALKIGRYDWRPAIDMLVDANCIRNRTDGSKGYVPAAPPRVIEARWGAYIETLTV